jgi:hypothetical protein
MVVVFVGACSFSIAFFSACFFSIYLILDNIIMQEHIENTMARARGWAKPISASRPSNTVWHDRHPDHPLRLAHPLPQQQVDERVAELMQEWTAEQQDRYDTYDTARQFYADWPDMAPHIRKATDANTRWDNLNRRGIWVDTRLAWSLWDPTNPLLCILTFPYDETCQFLHRTPPNTLQMWHVSLCYGKQNVTIEDMRHLVERFDNRTMQLWGRVRSNAYYLDPTHDPIASDPIVQRLEATIGKGIHISM